MGHAALSLFCGARKGQTRNSLGWPHARGIRIKPSQRVTHACDGGAKLKYKAKRQRKGLTLHFVLFTEDYLL